MALDWLVIAPIALGALIQIRWCQAYFLFPAAVERCLSGVDVGPWRAHTLGVARFVRFCAHAHWVMALRDVAMLALMYSALSSGAGYYALVGLFFVTLVPLVVGAEYSLSVARRLDEETTAINYYLRRVAK